MKKKFLLAAVFICLFSRMVFAQGVNLMEMTQKSGIWLYWDSLAQSGMMEKDGHHLSFKLGDTFVLEDFKSLEEVDAPYIENGMLMVTPAFASYMEKFFGGEDVAPHYRVGVILIDPGHGGKDPGASGEVEVNGRKVKIKEKDVCLSIGLKLRDYLQKAYPDKQILMTRDTDVYLKLDERTEIANSIKLGENEAILYVSIHVNSSLDKSASGYEVWYLSPDYRRQVLDRQVSDDKNVQSILNDLLEEEYTTESILIAKFILDGIGAQVGNLSKSRGSKEEEWFVVRNSKMPSVLVETGFLSNENEAKLLMDDEYLNKIAVGIYNGLQAFVSHFERSRGFTGSN